MTEVEEFGNDGSAFEPLIRNEYAVPQTCKLPLAV
jgi:hypothetical protein